MGERVENAPPLSRAVAFLRGRSLHSRWLQGAGVAALVFVVYWLTGKASNPYTQYVLLAEAFLQGRLYLVDPAPWLEVASYGERAFVIDPPAPVLFLLPWVAWQGPGINQVLVSMAVGALAMGLFWVAARQLGWSPPFAAAMTLLLALGTNFWWAATDGSLWTFAHVAAVFFLMAALVEATAGSPGRGGRRPWLVGILVGLAGLSRLPAFLTFPFFAYLLTDGRSSRGSLVCLGVFGLTLAVMGGLYLAYNYGRFGTLADMGYNHPRYALEPWFARGRLDVSYVPRHLNAILFAGPLFQEQFPFFRPSYMGMGLFFTTPALLYAFNAPAKGLALAAMAGALPTAVPLVTHGTTGWAQFGYRFSLDLLPLLAILVAAGMNQRLSTLKGAAILLSCGINLWGTLAFHRLGWAL